jgi:hypothetical protein
VINGDIDDTYSISGSMVGLTLEQDKDMEFLGEDKSEMKPFVFQ